MTYVTATIGNETANGFATWLESVDIGVIGCTIVDGIGFYEGSREPCAVVTFYVDAEYSDALDAVRTWLQDYGQDHAGEVCFGILCADGTSILEMNASHPGNIDYQSSASRQHHIDTGRYLTFGEVAEYRS